jgi:solute carrier family 36 (proton-coupled amino acid transporter)
MITLNLSHSSVIAQLMIIAYILILIPSILLQFFPAIRVLEQRYIDYYVGDGKRATVVNIIRGLLLALNIVLAVVFGAKFDLILSLIGSLTCSLGTVIPGLLHLKLIAQTKFDKVLDWSLIIIGGLITVLTTAATIYKYRYINE